MNSSNESTPWTYTMCGRGGSCCPTVTHQPDNTYVIADDYGGTVRLTSEELQQLQIAVDHAKSCSTTSLPH